MKKTSSASKTHTLARGSHGSTYVVLRDGRKIVMPKSGGKFKKHEIRKAVRTVVSKSKASA